MFDKGSKQEGRSIGMHLEPLISKWGINVQFFTLPSVQTSSAAHLASYLMSICVSVTEQKANWMQSWPVNSIYCHGKEFMQLY